MKTKAELLAEIKNTKESRVPLEVAIDTRDALVHLAHEREEVKYTLQQIDGAITLLANTVIRIANKYDH